MKVVVEQGDLQQLMQSPTGCIEFVIQGGVNQEKTGDCTALMKAYIKIVRTEEVLNYMLSAPPYEKD